MTTTKRKKTSSSKRRLRKVPFQAYLHPEQAEGLRELAERMREPQQRYVREGVDLVLAKYKGK